MNPKYSYSIKVFSPVIIRSILIGCIASVFFSCSSARRIEKKQTKVVYESLGLSRDRKDNLALYEEAASWLHVPHVDGGTSRQGADCSFLVYTIYKIVYGKTIERNTTAILAKNCERISRNRLREGDLVFFKTNGKSKWLVNHVGIYLKENKFLHSSTSRGVVVSSLDEKYFLKVWVCGGRVK